MKAYVIYPPLEVFGEQNDRAAAATRLIADIVLRSLRRDGDMFQYAVTWANPGEDPGGSFNTDTAVAHIVRFDTDESLRSWLLTSVNPNASGGGDVRSIATCRTATFGHDGQAFLCLRHDDHAPVSPDATLAIVEERPDLLGASDYFDGWVRDEG